MTNWIELAERVEALDGPCRETDAMIVVALDLRPSWCIAYADCPLFIDLNSSFESPPIRINISGGKPGPGDPPIGDYPRYTASLDAARTLASGCTRWAVGQAPDSNGIAAVWASDDEYEVDASTPALALTAACLRARAAMENNHA